MAQFDHFDVKLKLHARTVYLGSDQSLDVELQVIPQPDSVWVLIREAQRPGLVKDSPVLPQVFSFVATMLRYELVHLKRLPDTLQFFIVQPQMVPTGVLSWSAQAVLAILQDEQYVDTHLCAVDPQWHPDITAALNSWVPPRRMPR